jgi:hypothetical protein
MNTTTERIPKWTGTAEVTPKPGNSLLGEALGAYVPVVGLAHSAPEFRSKIAHAMGALDFNLVDLQDIRQLRSEAENNELDAVLRDRANALRESNPVEFGSFHAYSE